MKMKKKEAKLEISVESDADSDSGNDEQKLAPEGHRIVAMGVLNAHISAQLVCKFCHGGVELIEDVEAPLFCFLLQTGRFVISKHLFVHMT